MRLLSQSSFDSFEISTFDDDHLPAYAILSHVWDGTEEVSYHELLEGGSALKEKRGYRKLQFCGERAKEDGLSYFWIDTCCINKATSDELSTAINSMFRYYQRAEQCYVFLPDVSVSSTVINPYIDQMPWVQTLRRSKWFTRGWTLQELIAPHSVKFYSTGGQFPGDKNTLEREIQNITGIRLDVLRGKSLSEVDVDERMSWAANRRTTYKEDKAYCLLGIFGVFLPLIYGEGESHALGRLKKKVHKQQMQSAIPISTRLKSGFAQNAALTLPPRKPHFIGRETIISVLKAHLAPPRGPARIALYGLGGAGKTAIAVEVAWYIKEHFPKTTIFWISARSVEAISRAYEAIKAHFRIPGSNLERNNIKRLVNNKLEQLAMGAAHTWLMVVDGADDMITLSSERTNLGTYVANTDYLPKHSRGAILFTTRDRGTAMGLAGEHIISVGSLRSGEAWRSLEGIAKDTGLLTEKEDMTQILSMHMHIPLAIQQAVAYIEDYDLTARTYLKRFLSANPETELYVERHQEHWATVSHNRASMVSIWYSSFEQLQTHHPVAANTLFFMACVGQDFVPERLVPKGTSSAHRRESFNVLLRYGFIKEAFDERSGRQRFFNLYWLVYLACCRWLREKQIWDEIASAAMARLKHLLSERENECNNEWELYLPAALYLARVHVKGSTGLLDMLGKRQLSARQWVPAEQSFRLALRRRQPAKAHGHANPLEGVSEATKPLMVSNLHKLSIALYEQQRYGEAAVICKKAVRAREVLLGKHHKDTRKSLMTLGLCLEAQGHHNQALRVFEDVYDVQEFTHGVDLLFAKHTLLNVCNLERVLTTLNHNEKKVALIGRILPNPRRDHTVALQKILRSSSAAYDAKKYKKATELARLYVQCNEYCYGSKNENTLWSKGWYATMLAACKKWEEAVSVSETLYHDSHAVLGYDHPVTLGAQQEWSDALLRGQKQKTRGQFRKTSSIRSLRESDSQILRAEFGVWSSEQATHEPLHTPSSQPIRSLSRQRLRRNSASSIRDQPEHSVRKSSSHRSLKEFVGQLLKRTPSQRSLRGEASIEQLTRPMLRRSSSVRSNRQRRMSIEDTKHDPQVDMRRASPGSKKVFATRLKYTPRRAYEDFRMEDRNFESPSPDRFSDPQSRMMRRKVSFEISSRRSRRSLSFTSENIFPEASPSPQSMAIPRSGSVGRKVSNENPARVQTQSQPSARFATLLRGPPVPGSTRPQPLLPAVRTPGPYPQSTLHSTGENPARNQREMRTEARRDLNLHEAAQRLAAERIAKMRTRLEAGESRYYLGRPAARMDDDLGRGRAKHHESNRTSDKPVTPQGATSAQQRAEDVSNASPSRFMAEERPVPTLRGTPSSSSVKGSMFSRMFGKKTRPGQGERAPL